MRHNSTQPKLLRRKFILFPFDFFLFTLAVCYFGILAFWCLYFYFYPFVVLLSVFFTVCALNFDLFPFFRCNFLHCFFCIVWHYPFLLLNIFAVWIFFHFLWFDLKPFWLLAILLMSISLFYFLYVNPAPQLYRSHQQLVLTTLICTSHLLQSIIIPVHNAERWLSGCLRSVLDQEHGLRAEVSVYLDGCTDRSLVVLEGFRGRLEQRGYGLVVSRGSPALGGGWCFSFWESTCDVTFLFHVKTGRCCCWICS